MIFLASVSGATLELSVSLLVVEGSFSWAVLLGDQIVQEIFNTYTTRKCIVSMSTRFLANTQNAIKFITFALSKLLIL